MAGPTNPTLGTPQAIAVGLEPWDLLNDNTLVAPLWISGVSYPLGMVVGYSFAPTVWAVGTTYALGQLVSFELTDGQYVCCISLQASNTGNVPYYGSPFWSYVSTAWDTILGVGNFAIQFQSLINNNVNNNPSGLGGGTATIGLSTAWQICYGTNNLGPDPTQIIGASYFPPLMYPQAQETETTANRETVNAANNTTGNPALAVQGGFQLQANPGGAGTLRQDFNIAAVLSILNPTLTFVHTSTLQVQIALTTSTGQVLVPGYNQIPALKFTSGTPATATINALTGLLTGVAIGTTLVTVTCGNLSVTSTYTCS